MRWNGENVGNEMSTRDEKCRERKFNEMKGGF